MSTTRDNKPQSNTSEPRQFSVPNGQSELPTTLPDFPPPTSGDSGPPPAPAK
jgi:hypothetical protein